MRVLVPSSLLSYTRREPEVSAEGATLAEALAHLDRRYPGLRFRIIDEQDRIREHIRIFINGELARSLSLPLSAADTVQIITALSGG